MNLGLHMDMLRLDYIAKRINSDGTHRNYCSVCGATESPHWFSLVPPPDSLIGVVQDVMCQKHASMYLHSMFGFTVSAAKATMIRWTAHQPPQ